MLDYLVEGEQFMNITEFLEKMKTKYGDGVSVKLNDDKKVVSENLPQPLKEFYQSYASVELPFGEIYSLNVALKEDEPFKSGGWLCFGFDGYFSYWLCKKEPDEEGNIFSSWDHEMDDEMVATHDDLVEFLMDLEMEYEPDCQVILVQPISDMKIAAKMKKDFQSPISLSEFIKSCSTAPYIISEEFAYKTALQIISDNKEYSEYIKLEIV